MEANGRYGMVVDSVPLSPRGSEPSSPRSPVAGRDARLSSIHKNLEPLVQGLVRLHGRMHHDFPGGWGSQGSVSTPPPMA